MKLTKELKFKIDNYFNNISAEELAKLSVNKYGMKFVPTDNELHEHGIQIVEIDGNEYVSRITDVQKFYETTDVEKIPFEHKTDESAYTLSRQLGYNVADDGLIIPHFKLNMSTLKHLGSYNIYDLFRSENIQNVFVPFLFNDIYDGREEFGMTVKLDEVSGNQVGYKYSTVTIHKFRENVKAMIHGTDDSTFGIFFSNVSDEEYYTIAKNIFEYLMIQTEVNGEHFLNMCELLGANPDERDYN